MSKRTLSKTLRRRQLDRVLTAAAPFRTIERPQRGWLYEIRNALGMSAAQLAERVGVRQSSIAKMERTEQEDTVSLKSLRSVADALDCDLVYALIPRQSLEKTVEEQALRQASRIVGMVEHTMSLEDQSREHPELAAQVQDLAKEMVRTMSREVWRTGGGDST